MSDRERLAASFDAIADRYDRGRLGYPDELVREVALRLDLRPGRRVLDLGAGTGKLTRRLVETGADVVAVEPGNALLARLRAQLPTVEASTGTAEAIPLPDASVDAATVAAAFHWFRARDALHELHRVLRRGGMLALVWNPIAPDDPVVARVERLIAPLWGKVRPHEGRRDWRPLLTSTGMFVDPEEVRLEHVEVVSTAQLVDLFLSISAVASAPPETQAGIAAAVRGTASEDADPVELRTRPFALLARRAAA